MTCPFSIQRTLSPRLFQWHDIFSGSSVVGFFMYISSKCLASGSELEELRGEFLRSRQRLRTTITITTTIRNTKTPDSPNVAPFPILSLSDDVVLPVDIVMLSAISWQSHLLTDRHFYTGENSHLWIRKATNIARVRFQSNHLIKPEKTKLKQNNKITITPSHKNKKCYTWNKEMRRLLVLHCDQ